MVEREGGHMVREHMVKKRSLHTVAIRANRHPVFVHCPADKQFSSIICPFGIQHTQITLDIL